MEKVILGLGSNVGNRKQQIKRAIKEISLSGDFNLIAVSSLYETEPWGVKNQRFFLNCVIVGMTQLAPEKFYNLAKSLEKKLGRKKRGIWKEREIDIDVLFYGSRIFRGKELIIPHPEIANRKFVLVPLNELMPDYIHPVSRKSIGNLLHRTKDNGKVRKIN